nr:hypothetical protein Iba_chr01dCG2540 [Ipomoea batatas]
MQTDGRLRGSEGEVASRTHGVAASRWHETRRAQRGGGDGKRRERDDCERRDAATASGEGNSNFQFPVGSDEEKSE